MVVEKASDLASFKGKKKRSYRMEFKKQVVVYVEANRNRSAASHFDVEPKSVRKWQKYFKKIKSTKSNRQRLDGGGRKCIDENLEDDLVAWNYKKRSKMFHVRKPKAFLTTIAMILPSKARLLLVVDGVKSLCKVMGSHSEEKLQLLRRIHCIW